MTDSSTPDTPAATHPDAPASLFSAPAVSEPADPPAAPPAAAPPAGGSPFGLLFQAPDLSEVPARPRRQRAEPEPETDEVEAEEAQEQRPARSRSRSKAVTAPTDEASEEQEEQEGRRRERPDGEQDGETGDDEQGSSRGRRRRRGGKGRRSRGAGEEGADAEQDSDSGETEQGEASTGESGRSRARRGAGSTESSGAAGSPAQEPADEREDDDADDGEGGSKRRRRRRRGEGTERAARDEVSGVKGSTRLEAKRQRRREGREAGRRRTIISEAEFLARRESVERVMVVRGLQDRTQIGVLEDGVLVEHYVSRETQTTMVGNVYLGRVQNVLPSMEAAFVDVGKGRNAVLYAGEVNWDVAGLEVNQAKRIENALSSGDSVLVQVTKDPIGHKGARLTSQISLPGRYLVYVPGNTMTGISRKLPDTERARLKKILKEVVPDDVGVIVRTAAEGASEAELRADVERLTAIWDRIQGKAASKSAAAPALLHGEPDMTVRVIRDVFNEDFSRLVVSGDHAWTEVSDYIDSVAPDLADRVERWTGQQDVFTHYRVTEALAKAMDRKVWLPSGGSLVIDRTEAMTVVDVNTGKFVGSGGNLEETVTKNNIEAAEEIVRQLRLRDIGGIIVIDFIDMVLESNRDLVVRRLLECLGRDRTKHQVAEVTSLGLVQMTRKRVGSGLIEVFSEPCAHCSGRGIVVQTEPIDRSQADSGSTGNGNGNGRGRARKGRAQSGSDGGAAAAPRNVLPPPNPNGPTPAQIAAAAHAAALHAGSSDEAANAQARAVVAEVAQGAQEEPTEPAGDVAEGSSPASVADGARTTPTEDTNAVESVATAEVEAAAQAPVLAEEQPLAVVTRPRRRRGRVVAPAGPPGSTAGADVSTG
jgi:ribonuclease E